MNYGALRGLKLPVRVCSTTTWIALGILAVGVNEWDPNVNSNPLSLFIVALDFGLFGVAASALLLNTRLQSAWVKPEANWHDIRSILRVAAGVGLLCGIVTVVLAIGQMRH